MLPPLRSGPVLLLCSPSSTAMRLAKRSPRFTAVFSIALLYAATFEVLAWLDPGTRRAPKMLTAPT